MPSDPLSNERPARRQAVHAQYDKLLDTVTEPLPASRQAFTEPKPGHGSVHGQGAMPAGYCMRERPPAPSGQRFVDAECKRLGLYQRPEEVSGSGHCGARSIVIRDDDCGP